MNTLTTTTQPKPSSFTLDGGKEVSINGTKRKKIGNALSATGETIKQKGRPDLREDEALMQRLEEHLETWISISGACALCRIDKTTYYRWMRQGKIAKEGTLAREIYWRLQGARAMAEHKAVVAQQNGSKAARWYLERSNPKDWGRRARMN